MSESDQYFLKQVFIKSKLENKPQLNNTRYFEEFSSEHVLKGESHYLSVDEVESGIVGGGGDGGVDSLYMFANRKLVREDTDLSIFDGQDLFIELIIIQSKFQDSFSETAIKTFMTSPKMC